MSILARFRAVDENQKASMIRKLIEYSTPDFDYFYLISLSILMATFGLLLDSGSIVIGSMLIAPLMYPILALSLGLVMSNYGVIGRSTSTLVKSLGGALLLSIVGAFLFGNEAMYHSSEVLNRTEPSILHFFVAVVAGAAVAYIMTRPEWSTTLPGVAISVALIPPLATVGVGIAALDAVIVKGASIIFILNLAGIIGTAIVVYLLMNLAEKQKIAESTIKREEQKTEEENEVIEAMEDSLKKESS